MRRGPLHGQADVAPRGGVLKGGPDGDGQDGRVADVVLFAVGDVLHQAVRQAVEARGPPLQGRDAIIALLGWGEDGC